MNGTHSATPPITPGKIVRGTMTDDTLAVDLEDGRTISVPVAKLEAMGFTDPWTDTIPEPFRTDKWFRK